MKKDKPSPFPDLGIKTSDKLVISETTKYLLDNPDAMTKGIPLHIPLDFGTTRSDQFKSDILGHYRRNMLKVEQQDDTVSNGLTGGVNHPGMGIVADYTLGEKLLLEGAKIPNAFDEMPTGAWHHGHGGFRRGEMFIASTMLPGHSYRNLLDTLRSRPTNLRISLEDGDITREALKSFLHFENPAPPLDMVQMFERMITQRELRQLPFRPKQIRTHFQGWRYRIYARAASRNIFLTKMRFPEIMAKPISSPMFGPDRYNPSLVPMVYLSLASEVIVGNKQRDQRR